MPQTCMPGSALPQWPRHGARPGGHVSAGVCATARPPRAGLVNALRCATCLEGNGSLCTACCTRLGCSGTASNQQACSPAPKLQARRIGAARQMPSRCGRPLRGHPGSQAAGFLPPVTSVAHSSTESLVICTRGAQVPYVHAHSQIEQPLPPAHRSRKPARQPALVAPVKIHSSHNGTRPHYQTNRCGRPSPSRSQGPAHCCVHELPGVHRAYIVRQACSSRENGGGHC